MARRVFTAHGPGLVVESETIRGREQFLVEGSGFSRWLYANELTWDDAPEHVNRSNTVDLPYDPTPQHPAHSDISTILPGEHEIDRDERLHPSESLSGDSTEEERHPGPNPDLFADTTMGDSVYNTDTILPGDDHLYTAVRVHEASAVGADPALGRWVVIAEDFGDRFQTSKLSLAQRVAEHPEAFSGGYRDQRVAGMEDQNPFAEYEAMVRTSATLRQSAWADVRKKALRLRRTGCVDVVDEDVKSIMANVQGDHGQYETFVIRQGHLTGNSGISEWSCSCPWGFWAFRRKHSYVGRLCSHAYAAYLELQSLNHRKRRQSAVDEDYVPMGKYTDERLKMPKDLHLEPEGFIPEFNDTVKPNHEITRIDLSKPKDLVKVQAASDAKLLEDLRALSQEESRPQHERERDDEISEIVEELRERGYDADNLTAMVRHAQEPIKPSDTFLPEPFSGSGPSLPLEIGTSEDNVLGDDWYDGSTLKHQDLMDPSMVPTDPGHTTKREMDKLRMNKGAATHEADFPDDDTEYDPEDLQGDDGIVANFQRSAGWIMDGPSGGGNDDIAQAANAFLRTAGRNYSFVEQQELIDEGRPGGASNLDDLDLANTHYL